MNQSEFNTFMNEYLVENFYDEIMSYARSRKNASWIDKNDTVNKAKAEGFTDGSNPMGLVTRAEVWQMLLKILEKVK